MRSTIELRWLAAVAAFSMIATIAACSGNDRSTNPVSDPLVSDEDLALATTHTTLVRDGNHQILRGTGNVFDAVRTYRDLLGALNANQAGEQPAGRREINWDGVPAAVTNVDTFPAAFFNVNSPRGVIFSTAGTGFRVSNDGYTDVSATFAGEFNAFSPTKLFVSVGSATMDVRFVVAGSNTPAVSTGFGAVFADVGRSGKSTIQYYDSDDKLLLSVSAPAKADSAGLSFVGAVFDTPVVARVRIVAGEQPLSATAIDLSKPGGRLDLAALDDFIYGEPHRVVK